MGEWDGLRTKPSVVCHVIVVAWLGIKVCVCVCACVCVLNSVKAELNLFLCFISCAST